METETKPRCSLCDMCQATLDAHNEVQLDVRHEGAAVNPNFDLCRPCWSTIRTMIITHPADSEVRDLFGAVRARLFKLLDADPFPPDPKPSAPRRAGRS